jgi:alpha-L-rhamnosidase
MLNNAKWITRNPWVEWCLEYNPELFPPASYLAKTFTVKKGLKSAKFDAVGLGQAVYYINGKRLENSYRPTHPTNPLKAVIYTTFELTDKLSEGSNRIGVILADIGYNDIDISRWRSNAKFIGQITLCYEDGTKEIISSDTSWKTADSPTLFSQRRCGERYDARLEIVGWNNADFDDSLWDNAHICPGPGGILRKTNCPPIIVEKELKGVEIAPRIYDFGENTSGWVRISAKGKPGEEIAILYSERLTEDGKGLDRENITSNTYREMAHKDVYIFKSSEIETFEQLFSYHGFQYVQVLGNCEDIQVTAIVAHTDLPVLSQFECDNELINAIHSATTRSILTGCHGAMVDCPHREQNEWTGENMFSAETINIGFDAYDMFCETLQKFSEDQYPNGALPCIVPAKNEIWEHNFAHGIDYDSAIVHIPYYSFKYTGDRRIVDLIWDNMLKSFEYFDSCADNYLVESASGTGDWVPMGSPGTKEVLETCNYRISAMMMAEMAEATDRDPKSFIKLAENIKKAFREKYIVDGSYIKNNETDLAIAIYAQMFDSDEKKLAAENLADCLKNNDFSFKCGVGGLRAIYDVLSENGYAQTIFDTVTNDKYPGFARNMRDGMTTLPEEFDCVTSLNHHFRCQVDAWFYKHLAGINIEGFGYDNVVISPKFVKGINTLSASLRGINVTYDEKTFKVDSPYPFTLNLDGICKKYSSGKYEFERKM